MAVDIHLHDTYFIVAHFHYVMMGGTVIAFLGGLHYWWPKMFGRMYNEKLARDRLRSGVHRLQRDVLHAVPAGNSRHAAPLLQLSATSSSSCTQFSTFGSWILGAGLFLTAAYLLATFRKPMDAPMNPWGGTTLEWEAQSPPITHNFDFDPVLKHGPYDFRPERPKLDEPVHHG